MFQLGRGGEVWTGGGEVFLSTASESCVLVREKGKFRVGEMFHIMEVRAETTNVEKLTKGKLGELS